MIENLVFKGRCHMQAWKPGALQYHTAVGLLLPDAIKLCQPMDERFSFNTITLVGKELVSDFVIGVSVNGLTYCAIGTDNAAPTDGDTQLGAELYRQIWDTRTRINNGITLSVLMAGANCTGHILEGGVFGGVASGTPNSGTLFSHFLQDYDNSVSAFDLTFEYLLTVG